MQKKNSSNRSVNPELFHVDLYTAPAIITHTRKIDDRSISVNESYILGEKGVPKRRKVENRMTEEEIEQFEKDWEEMWNSQASLHDCSEWDLSILFFDQKF